MYEESSLAKKTAHVATSTGCPGLPIGGPEIPAILAIEKVLVIKGVY
jgi:hypothetical protein